MGAVPAAPVVVRAIRRRGARGTGSSIGAGHAAHLASRADAAPLLAAGRALVADLDLERVLDELLEVATEVTGARYAAIGVLDEERQTLERFLTRGVDEETHAPSATCRTAAASSAS